MRRLLAVLALGALVVACSEQATFPQTETPATAPTFDISNAPPQTGVVLRAAYPTILIWGVPAAGLEVALHADGREFCQQYPDNIDPSTWSIMTFADKVLFDRILTTGQAHDVPTQVWPYSGEETPESFCAMVLGGAEPLATGVTRGSQFYSDLNGTGNGADIWLWNYHGLLTRPDGSQAVFSFQVHWRQGAPTRVSASLR